MFYIVLILSLGIDQYTKYLIESNLEVNETIPLFPGIFDLTYVRNTGAAFGMLAGKQVLLSIVTGILLIAITVYAIKNSKSISKLESLSLALIVGGGLGNLISRLIYDYVIDFFNFYFWPVFNVADICICVGSALLVVAVLILEPRKEKQKSSK